MMEDPRFVFLHGIGGRGGHFDPLIEALSVSRAQVRTPCLPAHLGSAPTDDGADFSAADWEGTLRRTAAHVAGQVSRCEVLVGHSTGGVVAMHMLVTGAVRADRLVVIDSNVPVSSGALAQKLRKAQIAERSDWRTQMARSLERDWAGPAAWRRRVFADLRDTPDLPMRWIWKAVLQADSRTLWQCLGIPVLYVRSTRALTGTELAEVNGQAAVAEVVAGHWPHIAAPDRVAGVMEGWL